ncbi:MAG: sorbosone dehydrogenase family protein [Gammaproteobacteria bacterium]
MKCYQMIICLILVAACDDGEHSYVKAADYGLIRAYPNLTFNRPVLMIQEPENGQRWYVAEQGGRIFWIDAEDEQTRERHSYLDFSQVVDSRFEGGLLGMAFHPEFEQNREVFLSYTVSAKNDPDARMISRITRLSEHGDRESLLPSTEKVVIQQKQFAMNHNGGHIVFGADDYLYIGFGDGGGSGDPQQNGQDTDTLLSAMLRLDVDGHPPYMIPADNPFVGGGGLKEIYAYGLRNPWRWSFDQKTGNLWLGDVGQNSYEEINVIVSGGNYGWNCYEANADYDVESCDKKEDFKFPVTEYSLLDGRSVIGGYVYRGNEIPELYGAYLFADYISGKVWGLFPDAVGDFQRRELIDSNLSIVSFAQDKKGELLLVDYDGGLYRFIQHK